MNLFVAGFPLDLDEAKLIKLFEIYGITAKTARIAKHASTGFSKGYGFVTIEDKEAAQRAISKLNGQFLEGSKITVKEARPKAIQTQSYNAPSKWKEKIDSEGEL